MNLNKMWGYFEKEMTHEYELFKSMIGTNIGLCYISEERYNDADESIDFGEDSPKGPYGGAFADEWDLLRWREGKAFCDSIITS